MNQLIAFSLCVLAIATTLEAAATQFTTKYDNVNVDEVLGNERLLQKYIDCILDKGKCTADGQELKSEYCTSSFRKFPVLGHYWVSL